MKKEIINTNEAGQRLDKYIKKYLPQAPNSFIYKMLRKKNITLNNKKADGTEKIAVGDEITFYFAEDTLLKFHGPFSNNYACAEDYKKAYFCLKNRFSIIYEDEDVLLLNKTAGILSQKAAEKDVSLNEALIGYLLESDALTAIDLQTFKPSVCNRLDRNTSGVVIAGKSLMGLQTMSTLLKDRNLHKYYRCLVEGVMTNSCHLEGYILKNEATNKVTVYKEQVKDSVPIITNYRPIKNNGKITLLEVELVTGKTHQIRAHLSSIGYPIVGDYKYGNARKNTIYKERFFIEHQLLHAYRVEFPEMRDACEKLSKKIFYAEVPAVFEKVFLTDCM